MGKKTKGGKASKSCSHSKHAILSLMLLQEKEAKSPENLSPKLSGMSAPPSVTTIEVPVPEEVLVEDLAVLPEVSAFIFTS